MSIIVPVILSGGSGSRLWPLSRKSYPKQLLPLTGPRTLLQETIERTSDRTRFASPIVICNEAHRFVVAQQVNATGAQGADIVLEPVARNTAPAAIVAALIAHGRDAGSSVLLMPSDHAIADTNGFLDAVDVATATALHDRIVTFGIKALRPETGFGYIRQGGHISGANGAFEVASFVEKPPAEVAQTFVADPLYHWNSGIFLYSAARFIEEARQLVPQMLDACRAAVAAAQRDLDFLRLEADAFSEIRSSSIDEAIMEQTSNAAIVPVDFGWNDLGSWNALWGVGDKDSLENVLEGDVIARDVENTYIRAEHRLVTAIGVRDIVVVETADAVMVADRLRSDDIKQLVGALAGAGRIETENHRRVYRPWGYYEDIDGGDRFRVKHVCVRSGGRLSLQRHRHRAEHWVIVQGTARVTRDGCVCVLEENQSTFIPVGAKHRLENIGRNDLRLIEVQSGPYLEEDDIERFEDDYGRIASPSKE